jgi:hypothetical protein
MRLGRMYLILKPAGDWWVSARPQGRTRMGNDIRKGARR